MLKKLFIIFIVSILSSCAITFNNEQGKIDKVITLSFDALKVRMDKASNDDFIIIFGKESCSHCEDLNKFINQYQKNIRFIDNLCYFDITTIYEDIYNHDENKHNPALNELTFITSRIVDKYLEQSGNEEWTTYLTQNDQNSNWVTGNEYGLESPTTLFYLNGQLWNVVKGPWGEGLYNLNENKQVIDYWKQGDLEAFNKYFGYPY